MDTKRVVPIFMCCARSDELLECTFNSYVEYVYDHFATPIIFFNSSAGEVENQRFRAKLSEIFGVKPYILHENKIVHNYANVQKASFDCLAYARKYAKRKGAWWNWLLFRKPIKHSGVMFSEDDITFSNLMVKAIESYELPANASFLTLYQPENGYRRHKEGEIDAGVFYGTQNLIFPLDNLRYLGYDSKDNEGYDRVWVKRLAEKGLMPYALDASYVQHNQTSSLLSANVRSHSSAVFRFDLDSL